MQHSPDARPSRRRLILGTVVLTILVLAIGVAVLLQALSRPAIEDLLNRAIGPVSDGFYRVTIATSRFGLWTRSLTLGGVALGPREALAEGVTGPAVQFGLAGGEVTVRGVALLGLVLRTGFLAESVDIVAPRIEARIVRRSTRGSEDEPDDQPRDDSEAAADPPSQEERVRAALAGMAELRVGRVGLHDVSVHTTDILDEDTSVWQVADLDIEFDDLHIHENVTLAEIRSLFSRDVRLAARDFQVALESGSRVAIENIEVNVRAANIALSGASFAPSRSVADYLKRTRIAEPDRVAARLGRLDITGFVPGTFIAGLELELDTVTAAGFDVDILHDRHKPAGPSTEATLPHDVIQTLAWPVSVQRLTLEDGTVVYTERAPQVSRTGSISFAQLRGSLGPIAGRANPDDPAMIAELSTLVAGVAPAVLRLEIPLGAPAPTMRSEGRVGGFDPRALNDMLVPIEGLQIVDGSVQQVVYSFDYAPGRATGSLAIEYEDLGIRVVNKETGGRNLGQRLVSLAAGLKVRGTNRSERGKPARSMAIDYRVSPTAPFFKILWEPIRDGLRGTILR